MTDLLFPTDGEWLDEYRKWPWGNYDREKWDPDTILLHVSRIFREHLSLPSQLDYYAPQRAALVLGALFGKAPAIKHGALAFAAWMVRQKPRHLLTSLTGAEICGGMRRLQKDLEIPYDVDLKVGDLLKEYAHFFEVEPSAGGIVATWLKSTAQAIPLATWLTDLTRSG